MSLLKDVIGYGAHADRPAAGSEGRLYYETDTQTLFRDNGTIWDSLLLGSGSSAVVKLDEVIVGAGGAATIPFSSIDAGYRHLQLSLQLRGDASGASVDVHLQLNGDTAANYDWQWVWAYDGTPGGSDAVAQTEIFAAAVASSGAPALTADYIDIFLPNYAATVFQKNIRGLASKKIGTASGNLLTVALSGWWRSAAAITDIVLTPASGNFIEGSTAVLYGLL